MLVNDIFRNMGQVTTVTKGETLAILKDYDKNADQRLSRQEFLFIFQHF